MRKRLEKVFPLILYISSVKRDFGRPSRPHLLRYVFQKKHGLLCVTNCCSHIWRCWHGRNLGNHSYATVESFCSHWQQHHSIWEHLGRTVDELHQSYGHQVAVQVLWLHPSSPPCLGGIQSPHVHCSDPVNHFIFDGYCWYEVHSQDQGRSPEHQYLHTGSWNCLSPDRHPCSDPCLLDWRHHHSRLLWSESPYNPETRTRSCSLRGLGEHCFSHRCRSNVL